MGMMSSGDGFVPDGPVKRVGSSLFIFLRGFDLMLSLYIIQEGPD